MEMRGAIARTSAARMAAKGDGFPIHVAAIGETAIAAFQPDQREVAGVDLDATKLHLLDPFEHRRVPEKFQWPEIVGGAPFPQPLQLRLTQNWRRFGRLGLAETHSPRSPEGGVPGICGTKSGVEGVRGVRIGHAFRDIFFQSLAMRGRPVCWFHLSRSRLCTLPAPSHPSYDLPNNESSTISEKRH